MTEQVDVEAPKILSKFKQFLDANPKIKKKPESLVWAIAQLLEDTLQDYEAEPELKGATVQTVIDALRELHRFDIAFYREHLKNLAEQKTSTIH